MSILKNFGQKRKRQKNSANITIMAVAFTALSVTFAVIAFYQRY